MAHLTHRALSGLSEALLQIHSAVDLESLQRQSIAALNQIIASDWTSYNEFRPDRVVMVLEQGFPDPKAMVIFDALVHEHPVIQHHRVTGDKSAFRISDFLGDLEWQERALYHEFFRPLGLKYQVCHFFEGTAAQIGFALNRQTRDFSNEERALLGIMAGHLRQAHQRVVAFTRARQSFAGEGIVDVDAEGRIQFFTEKAQALISLYFPNPGRSSHAMPEDVLRWFRHSAGYSNLGEHFAVMAPFTISREGWILVIRLASSPGKENHQLLLEEKSAGTSSRSLEALGLTPREAEVLLWVSQGKTNAEIAIILGAATGTIRKHVQNLLRKLCVETRTAAAAMALNLGYR